MTTNRGAGEPSASTEPTSTTTASPTSATPAAHPEWADQARWAALYLLVGGALIIFVTGESGAMLGVLMLLASPVALFVGMWPFLWDPPGLPGTWNWGGFFWGVLYMAAHRMWTLAGVTLVLTVFVSCLGFPFVAPLVWLGMGLTVNHGNAWTQEQRAAREVRRQRSDYRDALELRRLERDVLGTAGAPADADSPPPPELAPPGRAAKSAPSVKERLAQLKQLVDEGLVNPEEAEAERKRILNDL